MGTIHTLSLTKAQTDRIRLAETYREQALSIIDRGGDLAVAARLLVKAGYEYVAAGLRILTDRGES